MQAHPADGHSRRLATWVAQLDPRAIPDDVLATTRLLVADALGCALSGTRAPAAQTAVRFAAAQQGTPESTIIGSRTRVPALHAAFANTMLARIDLFDDCDSLAHVHAGAATIMTALAMAERQDSRGDRFLAAIVAGIEISVRIGMAVRPSHFNAGYHPTGTLNCFGTAATASLLLGLDSDATLAALGLAAEQAAGLTEYRGPGPIEMSSFHGARAALSGVLAAELAGDGFPAPSQPLEGVHGFLRVLSPRFDDSTLSADLGLRYAIKLAELKPYPGIRIAHGSIGAVIRLARGDARFRADNLRTLVIRMARDAVNDCDRQHLQTPLDAQYSVQYQAAVALLRGIVTLDDFESDRWNEPAAATLMARIRVEHAPEFDARYPDVDTCEVVATLNDGDALRMRLDAPPGGPDNPLTAGEIWDKFERSAARALPDARVARLRTWIEELNMASRLRTLSPLLTPQS